MFNRVLMGIAGLAFALSLGACAANTGAGDGPDEGVGTSTEAVRVYGHVFETVEGGSNNGVPYTNVWYDPTATSKLQSWGMPIGVMDYCQNPVDPSWCQTPGAVWLSLKFNNTAGYQPYKKILNPSVFFAAGTQWNDPGGLTISCKRLPDFNWFCTVGTGGPGFSAYIQTKYG